jgi:hypothetical protein
VAGRASLGQCRRRTNSFGLGSQKPGEFDAVLGGLFLQAADERGNEFLRPVPDSRRIRVALFGQQLTGHPHAGHGMLLGE